MKSRFSVLHSISTMSRDLNPAFLNLQSHKSYSTELSRSIGLTRYAESFDKESTWEITLYAIAASLVGTAMAGMTILWMAKLGQILTN